MEEKPFGKWRNRLWPIRRIELKKVLPLFLMKFLISLNYGILTSIKDTVIVTQKSSGAEVIPVLKGWIVLPIALAATLLYSKLSNIFQRSTLFYGIIVTFLTFFFLYAFVLFPNRDFFSPHASADAITQIIGSKFEHWVAIYRYWMHSLFFVGAELWGSIVIFLLFWGFTNQIIHINEAKRFYTIFSSGGNLAAIVTGPIVWHYAEKYLHSKFDFTLQWLIFYVIIIGLMIILLYYWINHRVLTDKRFYNPEKIKNEAEKKTSLPLLASFKYIIKSKHLRALALMVICYGLTINLIEITWKAHLKLQYPNPGDYQYFMGTLSTAVGILSFIISLFAGSSIIRFFGWRKSALLSPLVIGATGIFFLFLVLSHKSLGILSIPLGLTPLFAITLFGTFQNIITKALKYSLFDPTKEMAFIPLDQESKVKGKAAVDVVGSRLGKSGSAWIQVILIDVFGNGSVLSITPYLLPIIAFAIIFWTKGVITVDKETSKIDLDQIPLQ